MLRKNWKKVLSLFVMVCVIATNTGQVFADSISQGKNHAPQEQKGKYYGKTVEPKEKVKTVKTG